MIIVLAGLPATGKSALAQLLAAQLNGIILDKDKVRAALFPPNEIQYNKSQDDFCMDVVFQIAGFLLAQNPAKYIIVDGRPFAHAYQVQHLRRFLQEHALDYRLIECVCSDETARERLRSDVRAGRHPAADRTPDLYDRLKAGADPIPNPKLVLNTDQDPGVCLNQCLEFIRGDT